MGDDDITCFASPILQCMSPHIYDFHCVNLIGCGISGRIFFISSVNIRDESADNIKSGCNLIVIVTLQAGIMNMPHQDVRLNTI
jgi:hypothetical protein